HDDAERSPRPVLAQGEHEQAEDDHQREEDRALDQALERAEGGRVEDEQSEQDGYRLGCPGAHGMSLATSRSASRAPRAPSPSGSAPRPDAAARWPARA